MKSQTNSGKHSSEAGSFLLETIIALALLLVVATGVLPLAVTAVQTTENQGHLIARTAEYAQDKMEQLMALAYCDASTDTTQLPAASTGGTGLAGCAAPPLTTATGTGIGGSSNPSSPVTGYVDYLDSSGNFTTATSNWFYIRVWQISAGPGGVASMKQITAIAIDNSAPVTLNVITNVNLSGGQTLNLNNTTSNAGAVTLNIVGTTSNSPFTSSGGGITNVNSIGAPVPVNLQINYAGTYGLNLSGGTQTAAVVYAPQAPLTLSGGSNWYGSLIGSTINDSGGVSIYYDRALGTNNATSQVATVGHYMLDSFSWARF